MLLTRRIDVSNTRFFFHCCFFKAEILQNKGKILIECDKQVLTLKICQMNSEGQDKFCDQI